MNLDGATLFGFRDELEKIAGLEGLGNALRSVPGHLGTALKAGWNESGGWMGAGKLTSKLPVGGKSLAVLGTAAQLPGALSKEDPSGQSRTRAERLTGLTGNILGGLAATGAIARTGLGQAALRTHPLLTNLVAGVGGGLIGEKLLAAPFSHARKAEQNRQYENMLTHPQPQVGYGEPGYYGRA